MTFTRPYSGTFAYKGIIPSSAMNVLNGFANALDKTGDNIGNGGGISGLVDVLSGGELRLQSGSDLTFVAGSIVDGNFVWDSALSLPTITQFAPVSDLPTGEILIQGADAWVSAVTNVNGGNILISTGNAATTGAFGNLTLQVGHGIYANPILVGSGLTGNTSIYAASASSANAGIEIANDNNFISFGSGTLQWPLNVGPVSIKQLATTSGGGNNLTISSQGTTASGQTGGGMIFNTGAGPAGAGSYIWELGGSIYAGLSASTFYVGAFLGLYGGGSAFSVGYFVGTPNTQTGRNNITTYFASTAASGANVDLGTYNMQNQTTSIYNIMWTRKNTSSAGGAGNSLLLVATCNSVGFISYASYLLATAGSELAPITDIGVVCTTNNILFRSVAIAADCDWQVMITQSLN